MVFACSRPPIHGDLPLPSQYRPLFHHHNRSATIPKWGFRIGHNDSSITSRTVGQAFRPLANPNVSGKGGPKNEIKMVDPLEAKRLAAKQMKEIQAKEKFKRRRQIEAINGAWAMIGLAAALVIEGHTGKSILDQLAGYWFAIINIFVQ